MTPLVSIITVVKNNKEFVEDAIQSVLNQTYPQIEYIIIDGGSSDGTLSIIKKYEKNITKWISEKDEGVYDALNKGINLSSGDIVGFLHSDDLFTDEKVIEKVAAGFKSEKVNAVFSDLVYISRKNKNRIIRYWKTGSFSGRSLKFGWMPPHPALFVRKSLYNEIGLFDINLKIASDYEMILRIFKNTTGIIYIDEVLVKMRFGGKSNKSFKNIFIKSREDYRSLKKNGFSFPVFTLLLKNLRKIKQFFK